MRECFNCDKKFSRPDYYQGKVLCPLCGTVLDEDNFTEEPTFVKTASGQSQLSGNFVKSVLIRSGISQRTYDEASDGIKHMMNALGIDGGDSLAKPALRLFTLLVERNFTRGRTKELVQASCLYISCRVSLKPYLLIDFSEFLRINVYVLGAVFLQICKTLSLVEHDFVQKPVDPSLFIHRFTDRLFNGKNHQVSFTALRIIASMKRDWMQTGRKPSGLCGAALYISSLSHGLKCSKSDIIKVVHVCEATLTKRLIEFENTESGSLTIEEFMMKSKELEEEEQRNQLRSRASGSSEFLCKHDDSGEPPFAHGLCRDCYDDFIKISGGLGGGLEPPAFQRAQRKRIMAKEAAVRHGSSTFSAFQHSNKQLNSDEQRSTENMTHGKAMQLIEMNVPGCTLQNKEVGDDEMVEDSETLSDVDDVEVDVYLHTEEEKQLKKIVWEEMNKEYLEEQAKKEADAKAAREAYEAKIANCSEDALELAAAAAAAVAKSKKVDNFRNLPFNDSHYYYHRRI
ncbi:hypothetical protein ACS0TY_017659 [Phlomoides rotata]